MEEGKEKGSRGGRQCGLIPLNLVLSACDVEGSQTHCSSVCGGPQGRNAGLRTGKRWPVLCVCARRTQGQAFLRPRDARCPADRRQTPGSEEYDGGLTLKCMWVDDAPQH